MTTRIEDPRSGVPSAGQLIVAAAHTPAWEEVVAALHSDGIECGWVAGTTPPAGVASELARGRRAVLLVDLASDPVRGMSLVTTCRQRAATSPVIVVAENPSIELAHRLRIAGVFYLALHPVNGDEIRSAVTNAFECLDRHRPATSLARSKCRILVIDDDADFVASITRLLDSQGYAVSAARSGKDALEKLRADPPDLIVLDVVMEYDSAGYEVNRAVKFGSGFECYRHIPILMVSSIEIDPATRFAMAGEVDTITPDRYLTKPIDVPTFLAAVRGLVGQPAAAVTT